MGEVKKYRAHVQQQRRKDENENVKQW
jgi:hypothetical protein